MTSDQFQQMREATNNLRDNEYFEEIARIDRLWWSNIIVATKDGMEFRLTNAEILSLKPSYFFKQKGWTLTITEEHSEIIHRTQLKLPEEFGFHLQPPPQGCEWQEGEYFWGELSFKRILYNGGPCRNTWVTDKQAPMTLLQAREAGFAGGFEVYDGDRSCHGHGSWMDGYWYYTNNQYEEHPVRWCYKQP